MRTMNSFLNFNNLTRMLKYCCGNYLGNIVPKK